MKYTIRYAYGHYDVYNHSGRFLFSADSEKEAWDEIKEMERTA